MNFYKHHIGDYAQATAHLSFVEDAAYCRMLRKYYADERPLPVDVSKVCRIVGARRKEEKVAVGKCLLEFFTLTDEGWRHSRCDEEIEIASAKADRNRAVGKLGGRPKKTQMVPDSSGEIASDVRQNRKKTDSGVRQLEIQTPHDDVWRHSYGSREIPFSNGADALYASSSKGSVNTHKTQMVSEEEPTNNPDGFSQETQTVSRNNPSQTPDSRLEPIYTACAEPETTPTPAAKVSMVMRKYSIGATPSNPSVIAMAEQGIDLQMLDEACREARESKPGETISVGYIVKKLEGWKRQAALVNVKGALKRSNGASAWWLSNESMSAKATELGIAGARGGESSEAFKARIQAAINGRSAA